MLLWIATSEMEADADAYSVISIISFLFNLWNVEILNPFQLFWTAFVVMFVLCECLGLFVSVPCVSACVAMCVSECVSGLYVPSMLTDMCLAIETMIVDT